MDGARLLVAGDPVEPVDAYRAKAADRAEWRLGYLPETEVDRALGDTTLAVFPYRAELDQSGALLRALGAGVPAVVYDVGGLPEPISTFGAGWWCRPATSRPWLPRSPACSATRPRWQLRGGRPARPDALTWDASAAAHLDVYRELL